MTAIANPSPGRKVSNQSRSTGNSSSPHPHGAEGGQKQKGVEPPVFPSRLAERSDQNQTAVAVVVRPIPRTGPGIECLLQLR